MKTLKKIFAVLITSFAISLVIGGNTAIHANMVDESNNYEFGHIYSGYNAKDEVKYYSFNISEKSNLFIEFSRDRDISENSNITVYDSNGDEVIKYTDFILINTNNATGIRTYTTSRVVDEGTYYLKLWNDSWLYYDGFCNYSFYATVEPVINLKKPKIINLTSDKKSTLSISIESKDDEFESYEIQCSTNSKFSNPIIYTSDNKKIKLTKLEKGKKYYVRVREVGIYGSGDVVYSAWSNVKSKTTKKK